LCSELDDWEMYHFGQINGKEINIKKMYLRKESRRRISVFKLQQDN
jgi:hypothetical protein